MQVEARLEGRERVAEFLERYHGPTFHRRAKKAITGGLRETTARVMRSEAPVGETHNLMHSISARQGRGLAGVVGPRPHRAPHRHLVIQGTAPHQIRPRGARALGFSGMAVSVVNHPGARPNDFVTRSWNRSKGAALDEIARRLANDP